jgi:hypothetical protein
MQLRPTSILHKLAHKDPILESTDWSVFCRCKLPLCYGKGQRCSTIYTIATQQTINLVDVLTSRIVAYIVEMLGTEALKHLASTCWAKFFLIHLDLPFRTIRVFSDNLSRTCNIICNSTFLIPSAVNIHWKAPLNQYRPGPITKSSPLFSPASIHLRALLHRVPSATALCKLGLQNVNVAPSHQKLIFSLPVLRSLDLITCQFLNTHHKLPLSFILELKLPSTIELRPSIHLLTHLALSLKIIDSAPSNLQMTCFLKSIFLLSTM